MSDPSLLLATVLAQGKLKQAPVVAPAKHISLAKTPDLWDQRRTDRRTDKSSTSTQATALARSPQPVVRQPNVQPEISLQPRFSQPELVAPSQAELVAPRSGSQLYWQRMAALRVGRLYTRLPRDSFRDIWMRVKTPPTYEQWRRLLALEAKAVAGGQGDNRLAVMLGDSLSLWFPSDRLPSYQLWLNQGVSGDTTRGILRRLPDFARTQPNVIYLMAGVNDLKMGFSDAEILSNYQQIIQRLQQSHPRTRIVMQSILPTRIATVPNQRIRKLNRHLAAIARRHGAIYLDLYSQMVAQDGYIQPELTTDGIHLNAQGYQTWQAGLQQAEIQIARRA